MNAPLSALSAKAASSTLFDDLDNLQPGEFFAVTWAFLNDGQIAWTADYQLIYTDEQYPETFAYPHTNLAAQKAFSLSDLGLTGEVMPGDTAYLTIYFTAPETPGGYLTGWQLATADGERFGPARELYAHIIPPQSKSLDALSYETVGFQNSVTGFNSMRAGQSFSGNWTLRNNGFDALPGDCRVVYLPQASANMADTQNNQMGAQPVYTLRDLLGKEQVAPGETFVVRLDLVAPAQPGFYSFHWQLVDSQERPFGGTRWLRIGVTQPDGTAPARPIDSVSVTYSGPAVRFFTGIHGPADDFMWNDPQFQEMMRRLNMPVFFWSKGANGNFAHFGDPARNAVRLYWNPEPVSPDRAYEYIRDDQLRPWWNRGYRRFIFFNEPQFPKAIALIEEGMGISWHSKEEFARFLRQCLIRARADFPGIQLFTTPMSSNQAFDPWGWRQAMWAQVHDLVHGWCMHAYTGDNSNAEAAAQDIAGQVVELQRRFQLRIPIIVSEASVNRGSNAEQKARVARLVQQKLAQVPGVEGVFWYAADWNPDYDTHREGWFRNGIADAYLRLVA